MKTENIKSLRAAFVAALVALAVNACVQNGDVNQPASSSNSSSTATYTASLVGSPTFNVGKSVFQVKLVDTNGTGKAGLNPLIVPSMDMGTMIHTTPVDTIVDNGSGNYTVTAYFIMASMGGTWYLKFFDAGGTNQIASALTITVGGMGTAKVSVSSDGTDQYDQMGTATNRNYFVFIDSITGTAGNHTVDVFVATRKSLMSHPALATGLTLKPFTGSDWSVTSIAAQLTSHGGPYTATNNGTGHFRFSNVTGLSSGSNTGVTFSVSVNGTAKGSGALTATAP